MATSTSPDPTSMFLSAAAGAADSVAGAIASAANQKRLLQAQRDAVQAQKDQSTADIATREATEDPFRQQMFQAGDLGKLDLMERAAYTPVRLSPDAHYAASVPHITGGFSYEKSPELIAAARTLKQNVMGGNVAPTMTDPTNYGKTAALNIAKIVADGADPTTISGAAGPARNPTDYLRGQQTRDAGGLGAAETRGTDVSTAQAQQILDKAIRQDLGRAPNPGEIDQMLAAQGLKPGDRWVGNAGLTGLLQAIHQQVAGPGAATAPSYTGRG